MRNTLLLIGVAVVAGGLVALLVVRSNAQRGSEDTAETVELRPEFLVEDDEPGYRSYTEIGVRDALLAAVDAQVETDGQFSQLAVERADMLFDTDFATWESYVEVSVGEPLGSWSQIGSDRFQEIWEASIAPYLSARIHADGVIVRSIDPDRGFPENQPGTVIVRSNANLTAPYRKFPTPSGSDLREAMEVLIPVQVADKSGETLGATIAFVLVRDNPNEDWREVDMFIYVGDNGFGRSIVLPPF
jgi:hypothetical protein